MRQAKVAEQESMAGRYRQAMHGIPFALKDIVKTAGTPTTAHSQALKFHVPGNDAVVVTRLANVGSVRLGKPACLEFAHGSPSADQS